MKLTCDLCGGALQMNAGAKDASCKNCGLCYSLEMLREKIGLGQSAQAKPTTSYQVPVAPQPSVPEKPQPQPPVVPQPSVTTAPEAPSKPAQEPRFMMQVDKLYPANVIAGTVQYGSIGIGETVYINGDETMAYRVYRFDHDLEKTYATVGESVELTLDRCPKGVLLRTHTLVGQSVPEMNAYRFGDDVDAYFTYLLQENFPEYTVQTQVTLDGLKLPVNYLLSKNGQAKMAIFVISTNDSCARSQVKTAARLCASRGIGCTHFFSGYRNEASYAVERIRSAMI